jgi:UPF0716 family protein affecting phage T7 exclusion
MIVEEVLSNSCATATAGWSRSFSSTMSAAALVLIAVGGFLMFTPGFC